MASNGSALKVRGVANRDRGFELEAVRLARERLQAFGGAVERGDLGAGDGELRGLAAGRRAEVENPLSRRHAEHARGQRGGGVLNPPYAVRIAGEFRDRGVALEADGSGRQHAGRRVFRPVRRVALDREVERRFVAKRGGDLMGALLAIDPAPAGGEPVRDVVFERIGLIEEFRRGGGPDCAGRR